MGGALKDDGDLGDTLTEALAGAQVEGNARPAARVHEELDRGEGIGRRVGGDAVLLEVTAHLGTALPAARVLAARGVDGQVLGQANSREDLFLLRADFLRSEVDGFLHGG